MECQSRLCADAEPAYRHSARVGADRSRDTGWFPDVRPLLRSLPRAIELQPQWIDELQAELVGDRGRPVQPVQLDMERQQWFVRQNQPRRWQHTLRDPAADGRDEGP